MNCKLIPYNPNALIFLFNINNKLSKRCLFSISMSNLSLSCGCFGPPSTFYLLQCPICHFLAAVLDFHLPFNRPEIQFFTFPQLFWTSINLSSTSASNQQNLPHQLHKQHITYRSACDRNKHLPFPFVKKNCHNNCNQLWQTITAACHINIFKAVHIAYMR